MKKGCELCGKPARMYCDSDQAILCWDCDERVHCANFLVAKHSRCLLCHVCQSPTPWKASGTKLGPTVSVCESCSNGHEGAKTPRRRQEEEEMESFVGEDSDDSEAESDEEGRERDDYSEDDDDYDDDDDDDDDEDSTEEEEEDGENQVVPWSPSAVPSSSAPPVTTSSCSEQGSFSTREGGEAVSSALKRFRHNPRLGSDDEDGCCSSQVTKTAAMEETEASFRATKMARTEEYSSSNTGETESRKLRRMEIMSSLMRFQQRMVCGEHNPSEIIRGISKLSRDI